MNFFKGVTVFVLIRRSADRSSSSGTELLPHSHTMKPQAIFAKLQHRESVSKEEPVGVSGNPISMVSFSGEITDRHTKQRRRRCADSHIQPMSPF